jgi:hypothetical protein
MISVSTILIGSLIAVLRKVRGANVPTGWVEDIADMSRPGLLG